MDSGGCVTVLGEGRVPGDGQRTGVHQWTQVGVSLLTLGKFVHSVTSLQLAL